MTTCSLQYIFWMKVYESLTLSMDLSSPFPVQSVCGRVILQGTSFQVDSTFDSSRVVLKIDQQTLPKTSQIILCVGGWICETFKITVIKGKVIAGQALENTIDRNQGRKIGFHRVRSPHTNLLFDLFQNIEYGNKNSIY